MTTDIDGLLARATADCADPTDLMEFTSSVIAYLKRLEVAVREVTTACRAHGCVWCSDRFRLDHGTGAIIQGVHVVGCPIAALAALLEETP